MNTPIRGVLAAAAAVLVPLGAFAVTEADSFRTAAASPVSAPASLDPAVPVPGIDELIAGLTVVDKLPKVPGYERDCTKGKACVYGPAWTDDYTGPSSHDGCDTRNNVLGQQLTGVQFKAGTRDCKVTGGTLADPYTGTSITFDPKKPAAIQIDHVYPLSRSWRAGAANWTLEQRKSFANDTALNLIASDGPANQAKSDKGLDEWLPPNAAYRCEYAKKFLSVAAAYDLAVTTGDVAAARTACSAR